MNLAPGHPTPAQGFLTIHVCWYSSAKQPWKLFLDVSEAILDVVCSCGPERPHRQEYLTSGFFSPLPVGVLQTLFVGSLCIAVHVVLEAPLLPSWFQGFCGACCSLAVSRAICVIGCKWMVIVADLCALVTPQTLTHPQRTVCNVG